MADDRSITDLQIKTVENIQYIKQLLEESTSRDRGHSSLLKEKSQIEQQLDKATETVQTKIKSQPAIVKQLCAVLKRISEDTFEIAKIVAPILITLSLSKTLSINAEPFTIALIAIAIGRMGVAALCYDTEA